MRLASGLHKVEIDSEPREPKNSRTLEPQTVKYNPPRVDGVLLLKALVMGIVEGLTEFLPVSSTGHLILAGALLDFNSETAKVFDIVIQTGAMFAIIWEYRARFARTLTGLATDRTARRLATNVAVAFLPAAFLGALFGDVIKAHLFRAVPVATAFIAGGLVILWAERRRHRIRFEQVDELTWPVALQIGLAQCLALIPGTSRAGATIIGALFLGLSRKAATEFSFFLAVPTLVAAGLSQLYSERALLAASDAGWFAVGLAAAFVSALLCVRWLLRYVSSHDFTAFAVYRIAFGLAVLATAYWGLIEWREA
jgi:undecaprenyl-diphosphatase